MLPLTYLSAFYINACVFCHSASKTMKCSNGTHLLSFPSLSSTVSPISEMFGMKQRDKVQNKQSRFMGSSWTMRGREGVERPVLFCSYSVILKLKSLLGGVFLEFWVQRGWQGSFQNLSQHSRWYRAKADNRSEAGKDGIHKRTAFIVTVLKKSLSFLVGITTADT